MGLGSSLLFDAEKGGMDMGIALLSLNAARFFVKKPLP